MTDQTPKAPAVNGQQAIYDRLVELRSDVRDLRADIKDSVQRIHGRIDELAVQGLPARVNELEERSVTRSEFAPVKAIVYGLVGLVLTGVVVALLTIVLQGGSP